MPTGLFATRKTALTMKRGRLSSRPSFMDRALEFTAPLADSYGGWMSISARNIENQYRLQMELEDPCPYTEVWISLLQRVWFILIAGCRPWNSVGVREWPIYLVLLWSCNRYVCIKLLAVTYLSWLRLQICHTMEIVGFFAVGNLQNFVWRLSRIVT